MTPEEKVPVIETNGVPQCPFCKKPTQRMEGMTTSTCMYYPPIYNEQGINTNPDRNKNFTTYTCGCGNEYEVYGNYIDGYFYNL